MNRGLARRLTGAFVVIAVGSALLTALMVNLAFGGRFDGYLDQQRGTRERQLATAFTAGYQPSRGWQVEQLDRLAPLVAMNGADIRLVDQSGEYVWSLKDARMGPQMAKMHGEMTSRGPLSPETQISLTQAGRKIGDLFVRLPQGTVPLADRDFRRSVNWLLVFGGLVAGAVGAGAGVVAARRTVRPITELTGVARDLRAGDRSRRATVQGDDEIAQMARAFNELVDSVEREDAVRRAFAADVAHELRTPLAVLRSQLEAIQDGIAVPGTALIDSLHDETLRLGRLTADLETMTSADSVEFNLQRESFDLADVVFRATDALRHRFEEQQLKLNVQTQPTPVWGDETRLQQVVTNLLTNALKFVPAGGTVAVSTGCLDEQVELQVVDNGPGISADDLDHVFERFYRGHQVRTGGAGIGLAVVAALVRAHGGHVNVENTQGGGASFRIRLPRGTAITHTPTKRGGS